MTNKRNHIIFYFLLFTFYFGKAQQNATPDKSAIRTAEPIHVQLISIAAVNNNGFIFPDSIPHFDIWDRGQPQRNGDTLLQNITISSYDSGQFVFPEIKIMGAKVHTNSFIVDVQPVNVDSLKDYHDIKDIIEVPPMAQWPYILGIGLITAIAIAGLYYFLKQSKINKALRKQFIPAGNPYDRAMKSLESLQASLSTANCQPSTFFTQLTHIYRRYLVESRNWRSLQQTGDELLLQAKPILNHELFYQFANAVRLSDAAKFAKYDPPKAEWQKALNVVKDAIDHMIPLPNKLQ